MNKPSFPSDLTFENMVFQNTWKIKALDGEYLDVIDMNEGPPRFTSHPISKLHHEFRIRSFEKIADNKWGVWVEPVRISKPPIPKEGSDAPGDYIFPFILFYNGCNQFQLDKIPDDHFLRINPANALEQSDYAVNNHVEVIEKGLPVLMTGYSFLNAVSGVNFPTYSGDAQKAFIYISGQLGFDPHSKRLNIAALLNISKPDDISQDAWDEVVMQLRTEIDFRFLCNEYFTSVQNFVQNVFISNAGLVDNVGAVISLEKTSIVQIFLNTALQFIAGSVGRIGVPGAGVVGDAVQLLYQQLAADRGANIGEFNLALADARKEISVLFNDLITVIQNWKTDVYNDWGKLNSMGKNIKSGEVAWPDNDEAMRKEAEKALEISLFKDLLKFRWNHMHSSKGTEFSTKGDWASYEEKNKNYWVEVVPTIGKDVFGKDQKGFNVTKHWIGRGVSIFDFKGPDDRLPIRIFKELGIPRPTVFKEWGMRHQVFIVNG